MDAALFGSSTAVWITQTKPVSSEISGRSYVEDRLYGRVPCRNIPGHHTVESDREVLGCARSELHRDRHLSQNPCFSVVRWMARDRYHQSRRDAVRQRLCPRVSKASLVCNCLCKWWCPPRETFPEPFSEKGIWFFRSVEWKTGTVKLSCPDVGWRPVSGRSDRENHIRLYISFECGRQISRQDIVKHCFTISVRLMIGSFRHTGLKLYYERGTARKLTMAQVPEIRRVLSLLEAASKPEDLDLPG